MKKLIVTFALCALPILPAAAGLPWTEQMTAAVTPEELKADRFVAFRKAASGMLELICGDTVLQLNPRSFEITVSGKDASFAFRAPEEALVRLQDGSEKSLQLQDAQSVIAVPEQWAGIRGIALALSGFKADGKPLDLKVRLFAGVDYATGDAVFELRPEEKETTLRLATWPGALDGRDVDATVMPHTQGILIPRNWPKVIDAPYTDQGKIGLVYGRSLYMPWWGVTSKDKSAMFLIETPDDAGIRLFHSPEEGTSVTPKWLHTLGRMGYTRRARLKFIDSGYVAMAKAYRGTAKENGTFRSITEKIAETPSYAKLIGSPILHVTARQYDARNKVDALFTPYVELTRKIERLQKEFSLPQAYIHIDGIGYRGYDNLEPDQLPVGKKAGGKEGLRKFLDFAHRNNYLVVYHQQYRDMYLDAPSYNKELLVTREDGTHHVEDTWAGGANALVCATRALDYVRRNNTYLRRIGAQSDGCYLDVFAVVPGDECYHPDHRMSRTQCYEQRRRCFDYIKNNLGIVSSEEPVDWAVRTLHLVHHTVWAVDGERNNFGIPLPLFTLVYHDAIVVPFETTRERGSYYYAKTEIPFLHALISAGMPYLSIDANAQDMEAVRLVAELHKRVGLQEMTNHEMLSADGRKQRSTYADGTIVTVDQDSGDWEIRYPDKTVKGNAIDWKVN